MVVRHTSLQRTDAPVAQLETIRHAFRDGGMFLGFTEAGKRENPTGHSWLQAAAARYGYRLFAPGDFGEAIAVRLPLGVQVADVGTTGPLVHGRAGEYPDRSARYVTLRHPVVGELSYVIWHANAADERPARHATNVAISAGVADLVAQLGDARGIVLASADTNVDDAHDHARTASTAPLRAVGMVSCWDELGRYPDTHGSRTIDVVYRYARDKRVKLTAARMSVRTPSDHRAVEATYAITAR